MSRDYLDRPFTFSNSDVGQLVEKEVGVPKFCVHHQNVGLYGDYYLCLGCDAVLERSGSRMLKIRGIPELLEFVKGSAKCDNEDTLDSALFYCAQITNIAPDRLIRLQR